jgi:hypothetical protein
LPKELVERYRECAKRHGKATIVGDSDSTNIAYDDLILVFRKLRNSKLLDCLESLLEDSNEHVRCWAATHYLLVDERKATKTLRTLSKGTTITAFTAEMVLAEWQGGRLEFPN